MREYNYKLTARNRTTCKDDVISRFDDYRLFDSEIDKVNPETHSDALITDKNRNVMKYVLLNKPYQKTLTKHL